MKLAARVVRPLLALLLGLILAALLGEALARAYVSYTGDTQWPVLKGRINAYHPLLGYHPIPRRRGRVSGPEFDIRFGLNAQGLRMGRDVSEARTPGIARILLVGDSFTWGAGVPNAARYGDRLEALLPDTEVINMGVSGFGTDQQLLFYRTEGRRYHADIIILAYMIENIQRNASSARRQANGEWLPKPKFDLRDTELVLTNVPVPRRLLDDTRARADWHARQASQAGVPIPFKQLLDDHSAFYVLLRRRFSGIVRRSMGRTPASLYPEYDPSREEWRLTRALLVQFAREVEAQGSRFLLVLIPVAPFVRSIEASDRPHAMIRALAAEEAIPVLDLLPTLREASRGSARPLYYPRDAHWTPEGHRVAAQSIAERLRSDFGFTQADD